MFSYTHIRLVVTRRLWNNSSDDYECSNLMNHRNLTHTSILLDARVRLQHVLIREGDWWALSDTVLSRSAGGGAEDGSVECEVEGEGVGWRGLGWGASGSHFAERHPHAQRVGVRTQHFERRVQLHEAQVELLHSTENTSLTLTCSLLKKSVQEMKCKQNKLK